MERIRLKYWRLPQSVYSMFFLISKILSFLLQPLNVLFILTICLVATYFFLKWQRISAFLLKLVLFLWLVVGYYPLPEYLLSKLEGAYPASNPDYSSMTGVVVLGGATRSGVVAKARGQVTLGEEVERMTEALNALEINPKLKILFTGFSSQIFHQGWPADKIARKFYLDLGIPSANLIFEGRAKNTYENAVYSRESLEAEGGKWGLITSANHMPRSVQIFQKAGMTEQIIPVPVDFRTSGDTSWFGFDIDEGNALWKTLLHEKVGTLVYKLTGKL